MALAAWMKEHYGGTMIQALKMVLPIRQQEKEKVKKKLRLLLDETEGREKLEYYLHKNQRARARLLAALLDDPVLDYELVNKKLNIPLSVVRALEEQGIGRPSTYAPTVSTILDRAYVEKEGKYLKITNLGRVVTELMKDKFTDIADLKFTAHMEEKLDSVEGGGHPLEGGPPGLLRGL